MCHVQDKNVLTFPAGWVLFHPEDVVPSVKVLTMLYVLHWVLDACVLWYQVCRYGDDVYEDGDSFLSADNPCRVCSCKVSSHCTWRHQCCHSICCMLSRSLKFSVTLSTVHLAHILARLLLLAAAGIVQVEQLTTVGLLCWTVFPCIVCEVEGIVYEDQSEFVHPSDPCLSCTCRVSRLPYNRRGNIHSKCLS